MIHRAARVSTRVARLLTAIAIAAAPVAAQAGGEAPANRDGAAGGILRIRQLDVGQGDAALITTPDGRHILIDAGPHAHNVAALLRRVGVDTLALVVASHNHADHIGGMPSVLEAFVVRAYVENGIPQATAIYRRTLAALEREPDLLFLQATDRTFAIGSVTVRILASPRVSSSQNNNSVGVVIEHGGFRALYTGDSEIPQLAGWRQLGRIPRVTLVKVAHHGSRNGTDPLWVRATAPAIALISVGRQNGYGHPSPHVELLWRASGAQLYRTDRHGTIEIEAGVDGRFTVREWALLDAPRSKSNGSAPPARTP
jgi:beta-lactamase superfamily II metal-dependent hydrolase